MKNLNFLLALLSSPAAADGNANLQHAASLSGAAAVLADQ